MIDLELEQKVSGYDINILDGAAVAVNDFTTAITVSLFSDSRADPSQVALPQARRGWIGDIVTPVEGQNYGSLLWLVHQERLTQATLNKAVSFAKTSLQWLIDQGHAKDVTVTGEIVPTFGIALDITITSPTGETSSQHVKLWENTQNAN